MVLTVMIQYSERPFNQKRICHGVEVCEGEIPSLGITIFQKMQSGASLPNSSIMPVNNNGGSPSVLFVTRYGMEED
jgi:hypothetical protein